MLPPKRFSSAGRRRSLPHTSSPLLAILLLAGLLLSSCSPAAAPTAQGTAALPAAAQAASPTLESLTTPTAFYTSRPRYAPGELVDYTAQTGDTLPGLALRFNTTVGEILEANGFIPKDATSMPPGMPMKIPIYYLPLWGSPYRILPDSQFVNGPAQIGFDTSQFVAERQGWLRDYSAYVSDANRSGAQIVDLVAQNYSLSPRLLLALLEYQSGALSQPLPTPEDQDFPLDFHRWDRKGLFLQLAHAANQLNDAYYRIRTNQQIEIELKDGRLERLDPWQNAASAALHIYFNLVYDVTEYNQAISPDGLAATYQSLFGDPWGTEPHIPGSLVQPEFLLPFEPGDVWALTGGPHTAWGTGEPLAALDFAPPSKSSGCVTTDRWATAVADGVVVRSNVGEIMLDLDGDGDERTGWNVYYLHLGSDGRLPLGAKVKQGERVGHPSCEGGSATGTHVHIARKYNGEWIPADGWQGILAFNLEGWTAHKGSQVYLGTLTRHAELVTACTCSNAASWVKSDRIPLHAPTPEPPGGDYDLAIANIRKVTDKPDLWLNFKEIIADPNLNLRKVIVFTDGPGNEYTVDYTTYQVIEFVQNHGGSPPEPVEFSVDDLRYLAHEFASHNSLAFASQSDQLTFSEMTKDGTNYAFRWETPVGTDLARRPFLQVVIGLDGRIIGYINTLDLPTT